MLEPIPYRQQYSNSSSNELEHSNSTVQLPINDVLPNLSDLVKPDDDYLPYYVSRYRDLGYARFMWLANKARAGKNPPRLFWWMLHNPDIVR